MSVIKREFGKLNVEEVFEYALVGASLEARVLTYGATISKIIFDSRDMVLGFKDLDGYLANDSYIGATVGRFANRIKNGCFSIGGKDYQVTCNEKGRGHLHGGKIGFDKKIWSAEIIDDGDRPSVRMNVGACDGEEGFPGNITVSVTFTVNDSGLSIEYSAVSDADTLFSPTNHSYFTLGNPKVTHDSLVHLESSFYTPVGDGFVPDGSVIPVKNTAFDFLTSARVRDAITSDDPQIKLAGGLDHNFALDHKEGEYAVAAKVTAPDGTTMVCSTDRPGIQIYTTSFGAGDELVETICFETQGFPDAPNHASFPSAVLRADTPFYSKTEYAFGKE